MDKAPLFIRNDIDLAAALDRAEELSGYVNDSAEEELEAITREVAAYRGALMVLRLNDPPLTDDRAGLRGR